LATHRDARRATATRVSGDADARATERRDMADIPRPMPQGAQGANANMQFMDFNRAQAYPNYDAYAPRATSSGSHGCGGGGGHGSGHQGGGFGFGARDGDVGGSYAHVEDEAPLLEELGVDPKQIYRRTMGVMHPFRVEDSTDEDLAGPLLFCLVMGACNLLAGKLHFGYILGWSTLASLGMYWLLNQIIGGGEGIGLNRCGSILGYALLPVVGYSGIVLFLPSKTGMLSKALAVLCVTWSSRKASVGLIQAMPQSEGKRMIVTYPCMMLYTLYIVFSMS
tara:strand:+ start:1686 stop:2525 length:840 start_codon:yes stop_codon:yes gene_type:complete